MPTLRGPRGKMTRALVTRYEVGDRVRLTADLETHSEGPLPRVGEVGTIRRIRIADPNDGDVTILMLDVKWVDYGRVVRVGEDEITPAADTEATEWLRRQPDGLASPRQEG